MCKAWPQSEVSGGTSEDDLYKLAKVLSKWLSNLVPFRALVEWLGAS